MSLVVLWRQSSPESVPKRWVLFWLLWPVQVGPDLHQSGQPVVGGQLARRDVVQDEQDVPLLNPQVEEQSSVAVYHCASHCWLLSEAKQGWVWSILGWETRGCLCHASENTSADLGFCCKNNCYHQVGVDDVSSEHLEAFNESNQLQYKTLQV